MKLSEGIIIMKTNEIENTQDVIDSRDVIERIEELESLLEDDFQCPDCEQSEPVAEFGENEVCPHCGEGVLIELEGMFLSEIKTELEALKALSDQCQYGDWDYGAALINDDYFTEYAQQLAEDIGAISDDLSWPGRHIDWEAAADELKMDYTCVDFDGQDYWIRS